MLPTAFEEAFACAGRDMKEYLNLKMLDEMLYLRPHNRLNGYANVYLVGGGDSSRNPGSGLPTIVESGRIAAELIAQVQ